MTDQKPELVYISGPMRGHPEFNYPAFNEAAKVLKAEGYAVLNPASNFEGVDNLPREMYMKHDFIHVLQADLVIVLDQWYLSEGAKIEVAVAQQCNIPVYNYGTRYHMPLTVHTELHYAQ